MAIFSLVNAVVFVGGDDMTGVSNKLSASTMAAELDVTTFGSGYVSRIGGMKDASLVVAGFADFAQTFDENSINGLGGQPLTCTFGPTGADGSTAYFFNGLNGSYKPVDNAVGDAAGFELSVSNAQGTAATVPGMVRGTFLLPKSTKTGTGTGTATQLGAVSATQRVYAACHVFSEGSSATVKVQSAATSGGSYTDQVTFTNPAAGGTVASTAGAITDTWWRVNVSAISGTYVLAIAVGIV